LHETQEKIEMKKEKEDVCDVAKEQTRPERPEHAQDAPGGAYDDETDWIGIIWGLALAVIGVIVLVLMMMEPEHFERREQATCDAATGQASQSAECNAP
jgi:hypothetical protein